MAGIFDPYDTTQGDIVDPYDVNPVAGRPPQPEFRQGEGTGFFRKIERWFEDKGEVGARAVKALVRAESLGLTPSAALKYEKQLDEGIKINPAAASRESTLMQRIGQSFTIGVRQNQQMDLGGHYVLTGDPKYLEAMQKVQMPGKDEEYIAESWLEDWVREAAKMLPMMADTAVESTSQGLKVGMTMGGIAALAGQLGPQAALPEELVTVPAATLLGFKAGVTSKAFEASMRKEAGGALAELMDMKDDAGRPLDPGIARAAAFGIGAINGAIEVSQLRTVAKVIPGLDKLFTKALSEAVTSKTVREKLASLALNYTKGYILPETGQEIAQESTNIIFDEVAKLVSNNLQGTSLSYTTVADIVERLHDTAVSSAKAFAVMGAPGLPFKVAGAVRGETKGRTGETSRAREDTRAGKPETSPGIATDNGPMILGTEEDSTGRIKSFVMADRRTGETFTVRAERSGDENTTRYVPNEQDVLRNMAGLAENEDRVVDEAIDEIIAGEDPIEEMLKGVMGDEEKPLQGGQETTAEDLSLLEQGPPEARVIGGIGAAYAAAENLGRARELTSQGYSREEVWKDTGWMKGVDDKWRFEIDDSQIQWKRALPLREWVPEDANVPHGPERKVGYPKLSELIDHPTLFAQYPELKDVQVFPQEGKSSSFMFRGKDQKRPGMVILIGRDNTADIQQQHLIHEVQHAVQRLEGFTGGANFNQIADDYRRMLKDLNEQIDEINVRLSDLAEQMENPDINPEALQEKYDELLELRDELRAEVMKIEGPNDEGAIGYREKAWSEYSRTAGEAEAREVANRMGMTAEERAANIPGWDGLSESDLIVRDSGGPGAVRTIPVSYAKRIDIPVRIPQDPEFIEAVKNTPGAEITEDGLELDVSRFQKPDQEQQVSLRTGVFYLPEKKSPQATYYTRPSNVYGGKQQITGRTLVKNPIVVKAATGGRAPELAYDSLKGKGAYEKMRSRVLSKITGWNKRVTVDDIEEILMDYDGDPSVAGDILEHSNKGNLMAYAIQENIVAAAVREAGHDAVLGYSKRQGKMMLSELFDVREDVYPDAEGSFSVHPDFTIRPEGSAEGEGIARLEEEWAATLEDTSPNDEVRKKNKKLRKQIVDKYKNTLGPLFVEPPATDPGKKPAGEGATFKGTAGIRTISRAIKDFFRKGFIDLKGAEVRTSADLAVLAQVYRDPLVETVRYFYIKDGVVVAHEGVSANMPGMAKPFTSGKSQVRSLFEIARRMERLGADGFWMLHNHPSGNAEASDPDKSMDAWFKRLSTYNHPIFKYIGDRYRGHVIIDSGEYSFVNAYDHAPVPGIEPGWKDPLLPPGTQNSDKGTTMITSAGAVVKIGQQLKSQDDYAVLIYRGASGLVRGIQEVPMGLLKSDGAAGFIKNRAAEFGAPEVFLYKQSMKNREDTEAITKLWGQGCFLDVAWGVQEGEANSYSSYKLAGVPSVYGKSYGKDEDKIRSFRVSEDAIEYETEEFPTDSEVERALTDRDLSVLVAWARKFEHAGEFSKAIGTVRGDKTGLWSDIGFKSARDFWEQAQMTAVQAPSLEDDLSDFIHEEDDGTITLTDDVDTASIEELQAIRIKFDNLLQEYTERMKKAAAEKRENLRSLYANKIKNTEQIATTIKQKIADFAGMTDKSRMVSEYDALAAAFKKAEQAARIAFRAGNKEGMAKQKALMLQIKEQRRTLKQQIDAFVGRRSGEEKTVTEYEALVGSFQKAAQAARVAFREGNKEGVLKARETMKRDLERLQWMKIRREKIKTARDYFNLSDSDLKKISRKNPLLMNDDQFRTYMKRIERHALRLAEQRQARLELLTLIEDRQFKKVDNYRRSMSFPPIGKMTTQQLREFFDLLEPFEQGDIFLTQRELETVDHTNLVGIRTWREARERLAADSGVPVAELMKVNVSTFDSFRWDTVLRERNAFYDYMVTEITRELLASELRFHEIESRALELARKSDKSRERTFGEKLIPQDQLIMDFLETPADQRAGIAALMTDEQVAYATYIQQYFAQALDYLLAVKALDKGRENYFVHIRRTFAENVKDDGLGSAVRNLFKNYQDDMAVFNILDEDTGNILPLEKFFQFSLHRTGGLVPTKNVTRAFLAYARTFEKKIAFDRIIPKIDIYTQALTPVKFTPRGLEYDRSLKKFVNKYINNKKGRRISYDSVIKQGGPVDMGIRALKAFVTLMDLGLNIPVGIASFVGEQVATFEMLGTPAYLKGSVRMRTSKGKEILKKYEAFTGRSWWEKFTAPGEEFQGRLMMGLFGLFHISNVTANKQFLLGAMSDEEYQEGVISDERLAQLRLEMGRFRAIPGTNSLVGSTSPGSAAIQYKTWAVPIMRSLVHDGATIVRLLAAKKPKEALTNREAREIYRFIGICSAVIIVGAMGSGDDRDKSALAQFKRRIYREALTLLQAVGPGMWLAVPRLLVWIGDLGKALQSLVVLEGYKTKPGLKGLGGLKRQLVPGAIRGVLPKDDKRNGR